MSMKDYYGHHHHKRGSNCEHGCWATDTQLGHHHHKRGKDCVHGLWAVDDGHWDDGRPHTADHHHHHHLGTDCEEHKCWATGHGWDDTSLAKLEEHVDSRSYAEIEAELAAEEEKAI